MTSKNLPNSSPDTRQRLLEAAIDEFAHAGYEGATVRDICERAGANVNAINYHFGDKQSLYIEAVKTSHRKIRSVPGLELIDQIAEEFDGAPEQRLRAFIGGMVAMAMAADNRSDIYHQLLFREIGKPTGAIEHIVEEFIGPKHKQLTRILEALLPDDTDTMKNRLLALSVVGQCMHYKLAAPIISLLLTKREQKSLTVDLVADHICEVTMAAINAQHDAS